MLVSFVQLMAWLSLAEYLADPSSSWFLPGCLKPARAILQTHEQSRMIVAVIHVNKTTSFYGCMAI